MLPLPVGRPRAEADAGAVGAAPPAPVPGGLVAAVRGARRSVWRWRGPTRSSAAARRSPWPRSSAAMADGAETPGAVKRATRLGMGRCQGRYCGPLLAEHLHERLGPAAGRARLLRPATAAQARAAQHHRPGDSMTERTPAVTRPPPSWRPGLEISRVVTGLWQVADMERDRGPLDRDRAAEALRAYAEAGLRHLRHGRSLWQCGGHRRPAAGRSCPPERAADRADQMVPRARRHDAARWCAPASAAASRGWASSASTCCSSIGGCSSTRAISTPCAGWPSCGARAGSPISA